MSCLRSIAIAAAIVGCALPAAAEGPSYVVRAKRLIPVSGDAGWVIEDGGMVIVDGRITAIGRFSELELPMDLDVIHFADETIVPGFVAAQTTLAGNHTGDESISGAYLAADSFDLYGEFRDLLAAGVTTMHLNPGWHRLVSGRGAIVKVGGPHDRRVLNSNSDMTINLGPRVFNPPVKEELLIPPSGDQPIKPGEVQRPNSRADQYLALTEALDAGGTSRDLHLASLHAAWEAGLPIRIHADDARDLRGAIAFMESHERTGYIVGGAEAADIVDLLRDRDVGLVYTLRTSPGDLSDGVNPLDPSAPDVDDLGTLTGVRVALAPAPGVPTTDLRITAAMAMRGGMSEANVLAGITRRAAEVLGVQDRVGALEPGRDADFLVLSGPPLAATTHVLRTFVDGNLVYKHPSAADSSGTVLIRGGIVWLGPGEWVQNGAVLIEDGIIVAAGRHVPNPPGARVIDVEPGAFVVPGLIDARGHLGLNGDRGTFSPELNAVPLVGSADDVTRTVARSGVTTVITAPYSVHGNGSQVSAIRTAGMNRAERVVEETAAVMVSVAGADPQSIPGRLNGRIQAGKKYIEKWQEYEKNLEEWKKKKEAGELDPEEAKPQTEEVTEEEKKEDPITGSWRVRVFGGPLPEDAEATIALKLSGSSFEGRVTDPVPPVEVKIIGTFAGTSISGEIDVDTGGMGKPKFEGTLDQPDHLKGSISLQQFSAEFEATRVEKGEVEFKVTRRRRTAGEDGRPLPPPVDEALEPIRKVIEKKIPIVVEANTEPELSAAIETLVGQHQLKVVLLNAREAGEFAAQLSEHGIGVVLPPDFVRTVDRLPYHQGDALARAGIDIAFQSQSEESARLLPLVGLRAVERGMSAEDALAAFTIEPARMYGLDNRIGRLAPGLSGDVAVFSGHPFETSSRVLRVFVNGNEVEE